jgi:hypothetical protein
MASVYCSQEWKEDGFRQKLAQSNETQRSFVEPWRIPVIVEASISRCSGPC